MGGTVTSPKKRSPGTARAPSRKRKPTRHQATLAAYIAANRHRIADERSPDGLDPYNAKPLKQIAAETGMSVTTARHILRAHHHAEWRRWRPSFDVLLEDAGIDLEASMRRAKATPLALPEFDPEVDGLAI